MRARSESNFRIYFILLLAFSTDLTICRAAAPQEAAELLSNQEKIDRPAVLKTASCGMPVYSMKAIRENAYGKVNLSFTVGTDGHVNNVIITQTSGYRELDESAIRSVRHCLYEPALIGGAASPVQMSIEYKFSRPSSFIRSN